MDNPEEARYECLEEQYLIENAKFKVGNIVYFEHTVEDKHKMCIDIVTPVELCESISECKLCSASDFIYREYIYNSSH